MRPDDVIGICPHCGLKQTAREVEYRLFRCGRIVGRRCPRCEADPHPAVAVFRREIRRRNRAAE